MCPEALERSLDHVEHHLRRRDVTGVGQRLDTQCQHRIHGAACCVLAVRVDGHIGAGSRQFQRDTAADTPAGRSDQRHLVFEHPGSPVGLPGPG